MIDEMRLEENSLSRDKILFFGSLIKMLNNLKENKNVVDVYLNFNFDKMEVYVFTKDEDDFETEDFITSTMAEWESEKNCFPETFINKNDEQLNLLPRTAIKIC